MNSNYIRDLMVSIDKVFGRPEKGAHSFMLNDEGALILQINALPRGFIPVEFEDDEIISPSLLRAIKQSIDNDPDEIKIIREDA